MDDSTIGLDKTLKNINITLMDTQLQLKDVQKLLKVRSAQYGAVFQETAPLKKKSLGTTKDKLDSLKTAQKQVRPYDNSFLSES